MAKQYEWNKWPQGVEETSQFGVNISKHIGHETFIMFFFHFLVELKENV